MPWEVKSTIWIKKLFLLDFVSQKDKQADLIEHILSALHQILYIYLPHQLRDLQVSVIISPYSNIKKQFAQGHKSRYEGNLGLKLSVGILSPFSKYSADQIQKVKKNHC